MEIIDIIKDFCNMRCVQPNNELSADLGLDSLDNVIIGCEIERKLHKPDVNLEKLANARTVQDIIDLYSNE